MNVLFSITYYTPYVSGLTIYVKRLAERLAADGHSLTVLCMRHESALSHQETIHTVRVVRAKALMRMSKGFLSLDWISKSWEEVGKASVVVVNLPQPEAIVPALFARLLRKPLICIYHCDVRLPDTPVNRFIEMSLFGIHRLVLALSTEIVTYTKDFAENSRTLLPFTESLHTVYPPVPVPAKDEEEQKKIRKKIGAPADAVVGVASRLAAEKGIEFLLEAIPRIESGIRNQESGRMKEQEKKAGMNVKIVIAGPMEPVGEKAYKEKIMTLAKKYEKQVVFLGTITEEHMGAFYSLIDVLVLPSINSTEAFGMVQVEAMMMGVPVVTTNLPGVRVPVQRTGMGRIVSPKNSYELADAIVSVLRNKEKYTKKKKDAEKEFSIDQTVSFYRQMMSELSHETF